MINIMVILGCFFISAANRKISIPYHETDCVCVLLIQAEFILFNSVLFHPFINDIKNIPFEFADFSRFFKRF